MKKRIIMLLMAVMLVIPAFGTPAGAARTKEDMTQL